MSLPHILGQSTERAFAQIATSIADITEASTAGTAVDTNAQQSGILDVSASASFTLNNPTGGTNGQRFLWRIYNSSGGDITVTPGGNFNYGANVTSIPTVTTLKTLYLAAIYRTLGGVTKWDIVATDLF